MIGGNVVDKPTVRVVPVENLYVLQDCSTELCLGKDGRLSLGKELCNELLVFDLEKDALQHAYRDGFNVVKAIGYEGLSTLKADQDVYYIAGRDNWHVLATAKTAKDGGSTGCMIKIVKYIHKGEKAPNYIGQEIIAGALELFSL